MTTRYLPFDSIQADRVITADDFASLLAGLYGDGVMTGMEVTATNPETMAVEVGVGKAIADGRFIGVISAETLPISSGGASLRQDLIVARAHFANRNVVLAVKTGSTSLQQDTSIWEIPLAVVNVPAGEASQILDSNIDDARYFGGDVPAGTIVPTGGPTADPGFVLCDGSAKSRTAYARLFARIGTAYGAGDGSSTFNVPDLRGRFPLGKATSGTGSALGASGGSLDHVHSGPSHTHSIPNHAHTQQGSTSMEGSHNHSFLHTHKLVYETGGASNTQHMVVGTGGTSTLRHADVTGDPDTGNPSTSTVVGAGLHTHTQQGATTSTSLTPSNSGTGATGPQNPPFQVVNYQIKA